MDKLSADQREELERHQALEDIYAAIKKAEANWRLDDRLDYLSHEPALD